MTQTVGNSPAQSVQTPQQQASGNMTGEWVIMAQPGLTTSIPAASSAEITISISGLQLYDFVEVNKLNHVAGLSVGNARVSAAGVLSVQMVNSTAAPILLLTTDQYLISVERPSNQWTSNFAAGYGITPPLSLPSA